jgi:hypothetical protein
VLRCVRTDGSVTWQKMASRHAPFFALHDLTHFAVESTIGFRRGFFGLVAVGWEIDETTGKTPRGPLPEEAVLVECIVGALDAERAGGEIWTAEDFNQHLAIHFASARLSQPRTLSDEDLSRVRARRADLFAQWRAVPRGGVLELQYPEVVNAR